MHFFTKILSHGLLEELVGGQPILAYIIKGKEVFDLLRRKLALTKLEVQSKHCMFMLHRDH